MRAMLALLLAGLLGVTSTASRAYTPESGVWWNPDEPGTGIFIEIQDNYLVAAAYVYDTFGNPDWYFATGFMTGNARFVGELDHFTGGQCIGCAWRSNVAHLGVGGPIVIDFDPNDPTRGELNWGGRTHIPIERFQFYLQRPEDVQAGKPFQLTRLLGEWQMVLDFSTNQNVASYYGELLVFDDIDISASTDYVEGCRADNSLVGFCSNAAFDEHQLSGFYDYDTGEHVIVVENDSSSYAMYVLRVGTDHVQGEVSVYARGGQPSTYYPVRGFRSASRTFVEEGVGPSKRSTAQTAAKRPALPLAELANAGAEPTTKIDRARLLEITRELEQKLAATHR